VILPSEFCQTPSTTPHELSSSTKVVTECDGTSGPTDICGKFVELLPQRQNTSETRTNYAKMSVLYICQVSIKANEGQTPNLV